ncbi:MAG: hypothetical protein JXA42_23060, partial [Anaerolineales bacterium]|nr:hypothetical protein [Anaerolineales bacterium]
MDKETRNKLRQVVVQCRRILEESVSKLLEGQFGIHPGGKIEDANQMGHLSPHDQEYRSEVLVHLDHISAGGYKPKESIAQLVREVAFTHLNRLV